MSALIDYDDVAEGTVLPECRTTISRETLIRFCGASGDFAGPHWSERIARSVGFATTIASRGLIIERALSPVYEWMGDPAAVIEYQIRHLRPVLVPDDGTGAVLIIHGHVDSKLDAKRVGVSLDVASGQGETLVTVHAIVQLMLWLVM
jgi:acyl dehydratase